MPGQPAGRPGLSIEAGGDLNNQSGTLSGDDVRLAVQGLDNAQGQIIGQGNLDLTASRWITNAA